MVLDKIISKKLDPLVRRVPLLPISAVVITKVGMKV